MDLESELRRAMAAHVTGVSAPATLAHEARRRHHRTVRRRTTVVVAAAGIVVAVAMVPAYQAVRPQPVGAPGPGGRPGGVTTDATASVRPSVPTRGGPATSSPGPSGTSRPEPTAPRRPGSPRTVRGIAKGLLGYVPPGIRPDESCHTEQTGERRTTTCRWTGSAGWVEVRLVRDGTLTVPADMGFAPPMPKHSWVNGHTALRAGGPATPSQIMWIERSGLGVWVGVSPGLNGRLMRVAESVRVS